MKTFVCANSEALVINGEVIVTVVDILDKEIMLAIDAPKWVQVCERKHRIWQKFYLLTHAERISSKRCLLS